MVALSNLWVQAGVLVVVDNSIMAPAFQQPLALGADISMTSATKFIAGHSDVTGGLLAVKDPAIADQIYFFQVCPCRTLLVSLTSDPAESCQQSIPQDQAPLYTACELLSARVGHPEDRDLAIFLLGLKLRTRPTSIL